jgi:hypothetical protein
LGIGNDTGVDGNTVISIGLSITAAYRGIDQVAGHFRIDFAFVDAVDWYLWFSASKCSQKSKNRK